ncbi:MAG: hypothetical protein RL516_2064 [Bacteroidota bacterium]|jgi:hypothetical protein
MFLRRSVMLRLLYFNTMSFINNKLQRFLKFVVLVVSLVVIYFQFKSRVVSFSDFNLLLEKLSSVKALFFLVITFLLMLLNWSLESYKWKYLLNKVEDVSFYQAVKGVLSGLAIGFITPNRVGEFAGKIAYLKSENRTNGAVMSFVGSSSQLLITIQAGLIAIGVSKFKSPIDVFVTPIALVTLVIVSIVWFKLDLFLKWISRFAWLQKWNKHTDQLAYVSEKKMTTVYFLSLVRYLVFPIQYFVLFKMLDTTITFSECLSMTAISYFLLAIVPTYAIAEIGARGSINLLVFSHLNAPFAVLAASLLIWIINLIIPALIGLFLMAKFKFQNND